MTRTFFLQLKWVFWFLLLFICVEVINIFVARGLNNFGIYPREIFGLRGILFAPFLHGNVMHFASNIVTLGVFSLLVLQYGFSRFISVSLLIVVMSGLLVWGLAREAMHVGASGLIYGYLGFLLLGGILSKQIKLIVIALVVSIFYGGLIFGVLPTRGFVSWESHLFGFVAGLVAAKLWAKPR
ncbi:MAG: rhomboid family intramembrane serine protease [Aliiglaciecola sp.]|uniref:rhomboid family intramembrane serine protease n=1 Tax=Aliiglaciecola sp. M165 TaxID=2593649 RepID=UPI001180AA62|nr:rhomboid family intramembrane serine protease [Aliiglaciecola sp. M165]TRY29551.1 rhomboid family intramembrane serine protease [Aliiglaciecola sp. M165]